MPKASLIISVYKNTVFLKAVLDSLKYQTEQDFEVIITEDGADAAMKAFIDSYPFVQSFRHLTQEDLGWRKNRALNNAIRQARASLIIIIDGDCVLHPQFIAMHIRHAEPGAILAGKRVKLDEALTAFLLADPENVLRMQAMILRNFIRHRYSLGFPEEGVFIAPDGLLGFVPRLRTLNHLKGCNMSFPKEAIEAINGFDEDYVQPAVGEDADLSWRFRAAGFKHKSVRNMAVQYHLHHPENWSDQSVNLRLMQEKQAANSFYCENGLIKKEKA